MPGASTSPMNSCPPWRRVLATGSLFPFVECPCMEAIRTVVVLDAADLHAESAFWAGMLDGHVFEDETFHSVIDAAGEWRIGVQLAPEHLPPDWPHGAPQQIHMDLHVADPAPAHAQAMRLGARLLQAGELGSAEGHRVYADPAGHPFCIGWGQPSRESLAAFVRDRLGRANAHDEAGLPSRSGSNASRRGGGHRTVTGGRAEKPDDSLRNVKRCCPP